MSESVQPHRRQSTRLPRPWDSPGKNTAVGCHFLLQCMKVKSESEVAQSCPTLSNPMDCSLPGSSTHGIFQARVPEWGHNGLLFWFSLHWISLFKNHIPQFTRECSVRRLKNKKATGFLDQRILGSMGRTKLMFLFTARLRIFSMPLCTMNL